MKNEILAKRYAKALFVVGKEEDALDDFATSLNGFADLFSTTPEVEDGLTNPVYPLDVREQVMAGIVESMGLSQIMTNFCKLLAEKNRSFIIPDVAEVFQTMVDEERNICQGVMITAAEVNADLQEKTKETLEKITGKQVVLSTEVDPDIIGGIITKVGDMVIDGSIRTQLEGLKESIKGSE